MSVPGGPEVPNRAGSDTTVSFGRIEAPIEEGVQPGGLSPEEHAAVAARQHSLITFRQLRRVLSSAAIAQRVRRRALHRHRSDAALRRDHSPPFRALRRARLVYDFRR